MYSSYHLKTFKIQSGKENSVSLQIWNMGIFSPSLFPSLPQLLAMLVFLLHSVPAVSLTFRSHSCPSV